MRGSLNLITRVKALGQTLQLLHHVYIEAQFAGGNDVLTDFKTLIIFKKMEYALLYYFFTVVNTLFLKIQTYNLQQQK